VSNWRPSAEIKTLRERAAFFASIREFFSARDVLEVDTPCLSYDSITDVNIDPLTTSWQKTKSKNKYPLYLQTSPEFYMKRLLAAGSEDIFYLGKCFRNEPASRQHQPEFTMLEWYRCDFDMQDLVDEVKQLIEHLLSMTVEQITYQQAFIKYLQFDPLSLSDTDISTLSDKYDLNVYLSNLSVHSSLPSMLNARKDALLDVLFSRFIEGPLSENKAVIITHYPASQASLAQLSEDQKTAERFELYINNVEIANGFTELTDPAVQRTRFVQDNKIRSLLGKPKREIDENFISALEAGLPACSGVAIGVDRLFMLNQGLSSIRQTMPFGF